MPSFGNDFETEALPYALPKVEIVPKNVVMAFTESSYLVQLLRHQTIKMRGPGVIVYDRLLNIHIDIRKLMFLTGSLPPILLMIL